MIRPAELIPGVEPASSSHPQLLEMAAVALDRHHNEALPRLREQLQKLDGGRVGYHETLAGCWLELVRLCSHLEPRQMALRLAFSQLPLAFYSPALLNSAEASTRYLQPDLRPLSLPPLLPEAELARLVAFQSKTLAQPDWTHECHLRVATSIFLLLGEAGAYVMSVGIQRLNEVHGVPQTPTGGYHETLTRVWFNLVSQAARAAGLGAEPENEALWATSLGWLQDKKLPLRFYSKERIMSWEARSGWLEPDLNPVNLIQ